MEASNRVVVALGRLKDVFLEFPDTLLSLDEASAMLALEPHQCHALLCALEHVRFLERNADGTYRLRYAGPATGGPAGIMPPAPARRPIAAE